jgi:hypothetical protein
MVEKGTDHGLHIEVDHAVGQRRAHVMADRAMETGVTGGDHLPTVGQAIVADLAVEDQRIGRDLQPLIRSGQFVEEKDAVVLIRRQQEFRREPDGSRQHIVGIDRATDVDRLDRGQSQRG